MTGVIVGIIAAAGDGDGFVVGLVVVTVFAVYRFLELRCLMSIFFLIIVFLYS